MLIKIMGEKKTMEKHEGPVVPPGDHGLGMVKSGESRGVESPSATVAPPDGEGPLQGLAKL